MTKEYIIRRATKEDAEQYTKLNNLVWRQAYKNIFDNTVFDKRESANSVSNSIDYFIKQTKNLNEFCYVVERQGQIIGQMTGAYLSHIEHYSQRNFAELMAIYIHPDYQHIGIGKELLNIFKSEIQAKYISHFVIGVLEENYPARQTYEKWGGVLDNYSNTFANKKVIYYAYTVK